jgi:hypothetical protein
VNFNVRAHVGRAVVLSFMFVASLLAGCEDPQVRAVKARLVGSWVVESDEHGGTARRVLTLQPDGHVKEIVRLVAPSGASATESREGEWFFDGVNLKRKYTYVDGKPLTNAHFIYETHELKSVTASELVASSSVGRGEVRLKRHIVGGQQ